KTPSATESADAEAQAAVRRVFQVKENTSNPKRPFYIIVGALVFAAIAGAGYVWYAMQPRHTPTAVVANGADVPPAITVTHTTAASQTPAASQSVQAVQPIEDIVPPLRSSPTSPVERRPASREPADSFPTAKAKPDNASSAPGLVFNKTVVPAGLSLSQQAYAAFQQGDFKSARDRYQAALAQDPLDRDALLGLAALAARSGQYAEAQGHYLKVLEADPRDPHAQAGLIAIGGLADAATAENRLKALLAQQPDAAFLHFALGNLYAAQNRWTEAQQAYFKAYVGEPSNGDYAFNLAIGLDHLRQGKAAAEYYQKALTLAASRPANFNRSQAESRLRELSQSNPQ
ncbi:MAG TPA: tetratricopeptide repeat protein, partial [Burkholderiales bacterium]|nr:tetratricopeptide repeat protein [Burkholderiales bacterium]